MGDAVRDCCCKVEAQLATVLCEIRGVQRDIRESSGLINAKIELEALKAENARATMECRLVQAQKDCCCEMNQRFDRLDCKLDNMQRDSEIARLTPGEKGSALQACVEAGIRPYASRNSGSPSVHLRGNS